jgi:ribosomal-protein-alanine N-acetyltransferase
VTFLVIKPLKIDDLSNVLRLDKLCFGGLWTFDGYQREAESPNSDLLGLWIGEGELTEARKVLMEVSPISCLVPAVPLSLIGVGCLWSILEEAHIILLAIDPNYQRQGLGKLLLLGLLHKARERGLERATLEVKASNIVAISLYQKFGFKEAGRRRAYYPDGEDALILWRNGLHRDSFQEELESWWQEYQVDIYRG